ncbi:FKBP-type peptidyl-prolyl cis-trans isomerase [Microbacterium terrisoli]|uniref:FKBP-type peptidyl-prolyl cis-trans isomerase n=1 Tax=Microbacterium terrisoli TaxID=3242192 RepID=UPI0028058CD3|nr:hypothetical protein [Microbacterium protaetiae]
MRRLPVALTVIALASVALVGCSSSSDPAASCPRVTDANSPTMAQIQVAGPTTSKPIVDVDAPLHTTTTQFKDVTRGDGAVPISSAKQMVVLDVALVSATTGKPLVATAYNGDQTQAVPLDRWATQFPAFVDALHCATAGTRVALAIAPGGLEASSAQNLGLGPKDSLVAVVDVRRVYLGAANGALVYNSGWGMPAVVRAADGRPGVVIRDAAAPQNLKIWTLKRGDGEKVTGDAPVMVNYTIVNWTDKAVADTTWDSTPQAITLSDKSKGFRDAVEGQTVGSQVMAVIPKIDGSPDAKDTQVAVIDILGIAPKAAAPAQ